MSDTSTLHGREPASLWVERYAHLVRKQGTVLDLASGAGRHTHLFMAMGMQVTALDRNAQALTALTTLTRHDVGGVETIWADIENAPWPQALEGREFDAVIVTNYLWRPLLPKIAASVKERGVIIYETFAQGNEQFGKPSNPEFLLAPDELMQHFGVKQGFEVIAYEDVKQEHPKPACIQRICALRLPTGARQ